MKAMERVQLVDQVRTPGTSVDAAHIDEKRSRRCVSWFPISFPDPKHGRGVVETLQPCFGSLRARVRHADKGGGIDEVRPAWRPLRAPRSMGRVVGRDDVACIEIATALVEIDPIYIILGYI